MPTNRQPNSATLISEYLGSGRGDRTGTKYGLHWVLTPIDLHPLEDRWSVVAARYGPTTT
jgi:hypothetical protein